MSLKIWLPLTQDLRNQGISNVSVINNGATIANNGKLGKCYSFNGSSQYLQLSDTLGNIYLGDFSYAIWLKPTDSTRGIIYSEYGSTGSSNVAFELSATRQIRLYWNGTPDIYATDCILPINEWTHVAIVKTTGKIAFYINGVLKYTWTGTLSDRPSTSKIRIGDDYRGGTSVSYMGYMNDARIYDHCLSELEIKELAKGLAVHYKLDDLSSGKLIDSTGYGATGTKSGTITQNSTSPRGTNSLTFAAGSYISAPIAASGFTNTYTFSWWGKYTNYSGHMMWGFQNGNRLNLYMASGNFYWNIGDGTANPFDVSAATYGDGNWHHFAITGDGTSSLLYIDGIYRGTAKTFRPITGTALIFNGWDTSGSYKFNGSLSDFRLYSTCLTANDIKSLYEIVAKIDKQNTFYAYEINEDDSEGIKSNIKKSGVIKTKIISNYLVDGSDEQINTSELNRVLIGKDFIASDNFIEI